MPRGGGGTYALAAGNPVVVGTNITPTWANPTLEDIRDALTDSLSRSGLGGMTAALLGTDGTAPAPAWSFTADSDTGVYRVGANELGVSTGGVQRLAVTANGIYSSLGALATVGYGFLGDPNTGLYSPGADQVSVVTAGAARIAVTAAGNVTVAAPSSGVALTVNGETQSVNTNTAFMVANAASTFFGSRTNCPVEIRSNDTQRVLIAADGNVTINAPGSGTTQTVTAITGNQATQWTDGTVQVAVRCDGTPAGFFGTVSNHPLVIGTNATTRITVAAAGDATFTGSITATNIDSGNYAATGWVGFTTTPTPTVYWARSGNVVTLTMTGTLSGTSNLTVWSDANSNMPVALRPARDQIISCGLQDNGTRLAGCAKILTAGTIQFFPTTGDAGSWTNSGTKGSAGSSITFTYLLN